MRNLGLAAIAVAVGFAGVYAFAQPVQPGLNFSIGSCVIKGNISIDTGEHIYHMPGQTYYAETVVRPEFGERWFCSEAEARYAGWRKSRR